MATIIETSTGGDALTFDDVLLLPGPSESCRLRPTFAPA